VTTRRLLPLLGLGLTEVVHQRVLRVCVVAGLALLLVAASLRDLSFGLDQVRFVSEAASALACFFATVQSIFLAGLLLGDQPARARAALVITRGVPRVDWYLSRAAPVLAACWVMVMAVHVTATVVAPATMMGSASLVTDLMRVSLTTAFAVASAVMCENAILAASLALALTVASLLLPLVRASAPGTPAQVGWSILAVLVPSFPDGEGLSPSGIAYGMARIGVVFAAGAAAFSRREL
jgi:hypothetical protein